MAPKQEVEAEGSHVGGKVRRDASLTEAALAVTAHSHGKYILTPS
jgi:hypothetical protein